MQKKHFIAALLCAVATPVWADDTPANALDEIVVTATRFQDKSNRTPASVTVLSREDITRSSARTLPELLATQAGVNSRDYFGNNAASATVDMRGFGAAAGQNTLILLDGRRISDADLSGVQWAAIPVAAIARIEIVRGSGAVLYGDGATSGVINIITRSDNTMGSRGGVQLDVGSYGYRQLQADAHSGGEQGGVDFNGSTLDSTGYRTHNRNTQNDAQLRLYRLLEDGEMDLRLAADRQRIELPGARAVQPALGVNQVNSDPRGVTTPLDYASRDGNQVALGWRKNLDDVDLDLGLSQRNKRQRAYFDQNGFPIYRDSDLKLTSFTPRARIAHGADGALVVGMDLQRWDYRLHTSNSAANIAVPINQVGMTQRNRALYLQDSTSIAPNTVLSSGVRREQLSMNGADVYNAAAPGAAFGSAAPAGAFSRALTAWELGLRHQLDGGLSLRGKVGRSFRFANVDEIYESGPTYANQFQFLRPQTANGVELGLESKGLTSGWRSSVFDTKVHDEIHLDPFSTGVGNTNLPPSRRRGLELDGHWQVLPHLDLRAAYTYTEARFLSGVLPGSAFTQTNVNIASKHVPLVPDHKLDLGASWSLAEATSLNGALHYVSSQFMENDEANTLGAKIPAYTVADLKLLHHVGEWELSAAINNLFDRRYYNYAVSSQFTAGKYNAYPLPGRTFWLGLSYRI